MESCNGISDHKFEKFDATRIFCPKCGQFRTAPTTYWYNYPSISPTYPYKPWPDYRPSPTYWQSPSYQTWTSPFQYSTAGAAPSFSKISIT